MKSTNYEQRLRSYKEQKYKLLIAKQDMTKSNIEYYRKLELTRALDESIALVDSAINTTTRIVEYTKAIESEIKGYMIIEQRLQDVMFDYKLDSASTRMTTNKLNQVGEHLQHLDQLLKYKK